MRAERAAKAVLATIVVLLSCGAVPGFGGLPSPPDAFAQGAQSSATLTLQRQTPWVRTDVDPTLEVRLTARNVGQSTLSDLSLVVTLGSATRTRNEYDASLVSGPLTSFPTRTFPLDGSIAPGQTKTVGFTVNVTTMGVSSTESLIYPMLIDLRSLGQPTGGVLRTPVLVLVRKPLLPLELQWTWQIDPAPAIGPDGRVVSPALVRSIAPGGALRAQVDALAILAGAHESADVAISPRFLDELRMLSDGYTLEDGTKVEAGTGGAADAFTVLHTLRDIADAGTMHVSALPYAAPNMPALLRGSLARDLDQQNHLGDEVFRAVLDTEPSRAAEQAPGGTLDQATVDAIASAGSDALLGPSDAVVRPPVANDLTLAPTGRLTTSTGSIPVVLPDPGIQTLVASPTVAADPTLSAQQILGELAAVWQEQPSVLRGVAISTAGVSAPPSFWISLARRIVSTPFLDTVSATRLVADAPPPEAPSPLAVATTSATISRTYAEGIKQERRRIGALASMLVNPGDLPASLDASLLVAESGAFLGVAGEQAGRRWIDGVNTATGAIFAAATPTTAQQFTLTSSSGSIPILLGDPGNRTIRAVIQLSSSHLRFPQGASRTVRITQPNQIVTIPVQAIGTGVITVVVQVRAPQPSGRVVAKTKLVIRSTAYNRVALAITIGAALVLIALWVRRWLQRPTTS